ncbi:MAG: PQQ-binding-like beta-propeller repeat protein [Phycisphaeraceae bacterium]|nr:PQQ-binding-like beta-propeller repeat protein [Phycisphaeraceae bacterium]MCB9846971.1 PQQ-binding-like beta-propeller repeat protein [Phycisphaeraceae bacterium]
MIGAPSTARRENRDPGGPRRWSGARLSRLARLALLALIAASPSLAPGQTGQSAIYTDDSTAASEGINRAEDQLARGNVDEAVEVLRALQRTEGERVLPAADDPALYDAVRDVINRMLLRNDVLFERYLAAESAEAQRLADLGMHDEVERVALLTPAGFDCAIRLAQRRLESAQFDAAWLTLRSLEDHPTRRDAEPAALFATLATQVARYLPPDPRILAVVQRWRDEAGLAPIDALEPIPGPDQKRGVTPFEPGPRVDLSGIVSRPLWSERLSLESEEEPEVNSRPRLTRLRGNAKPWRVLPTVAGDTIYISDGSTVAAWDRFTLSPRWRTPLMLEGVDADPERARTMNRAGGRSGDTDSAETVTVRGRWAVASAPESTDMIRDGATTIVAIDAETGVIRWRTPLRLADPTLQGATVVGRLLIDQGVVVAVVSKNLAERRLDSVQLVGLELATGRPLWRRPLGSTGTLPFASSGAAGALPVASRGVVYIEDSLGFVAAVEAVSGRTLWVRDLRVDQNLVVPREPWASTGAVVMGDSLYVLTPDNQRLDELDAQSGRVISSRSVFSLLGEEQSPLYLLASGDRLVIVGVSKVFSIETVAFPGESARAQAPMDLGSESFQGRVVIAGDTVLAPTRTGLRSAALSGTDGAEPSLTHLEEPGNVLALESQLVVIDESEVRTYLLWDVAQRVLGDRMRETPSDPTPAVTFAELAYRAAKPDRILPAVEQALASIELAPRTETNRAARNRLFRSLLSMVEPDENDPQLGMLASDQLEQLIVELGRAAAEPAERVQHLMARGRFYEAEGRTDLAVESYQRVLDDPNLAQASIPVEGVSARAQDESTRSLRRVVRRHGPDVYAAYEIEARRQLAAVAPGSGPESYTEIALRYPVARAGVQAWLDASGAYLSRGRPHGAVFALESGLLSAEDALEVDDALLGEIAGRLINQLADAGRVSAASDLLRRLNRQHRTLTLTDGGSPIDTTLLRQELDRRLSLLDRRPRVGLLADTPPSQTLDGWSVLTPVIRRVVGDPTDAVMLEHEGEFALWSNAAPSGLMQRWAVASDENTTLIDYDEESVFLSRLTDDGWVYERWDAKTGELAWSSTPLAKLFTLDPGETERLIPTPLDGARPATEQRIAMDDRSLVIADRGGRVVAYDKVSGRERWRREAALDGVTDFAINAGVACFVGQRNPGGGGGISIPTISLYDNRTGQPLHTIDLETGPAHWVRITESGEAIVGTAGAVSLYDVFTGRRRWSVGGAAGRRTVEAWVFPGRIVVFNDRGDLRQIETESGQPMPDPMPTQGRVNASSPIQGGAVGDRAAFSTTIGILLYDRRGALVGVDHRPSTTMMLPAAFGADRFVTINMVASAIDEEVYYYDLQFFSMGSCALEKSRQIGLFHTPTRLALLDGRILVTSGPGTVVLDTE